MNTVLRCLNCATLFYTAATGVEAITLARNACEHCGGRVEVFIPSREDIVLDAIKQSTPDKE